MCQRVTCASCGKPSFVGCGMHIEQVLGDVPARDRCTCRDANASSKPASSVASVSSGSGPSGGATKDRR